MMMTIETAFSSTRIAPIDRQERKRPPADDAAGIERLFLVTVGLVAGLEVGLAAFWLMG
jgi:hypothetical protein